MNSTFFIAVLFFSGLVIAQERVVPADQESLHKVELKNDYIEVLHVTIPPGQSTLLHTHSHDRTAVVLSNSTVKEDILGKEQNQAPAANAGSVSPQEHVKQHFTHRLKNIGTKPFEVLDIELLKRPDGPATEPIGIPASESNSFRTYRWTIAPGSSTPEHTHLRPYLIIAATPMQLLMKSPGGDSMEHPVKAGDFHWVDSKVTHTLINNGKESGTIIEVEIR